MSLENKTIVFGFMEDFYIKEYLLYEINKMMKIKDLKIIPILNYNKEKNIRKITDKDISLIEKITQNKMLYFNEDEINHKLIKSADILILTSCNEEFIYKIANNIFDNSILNFIRLYKENKKPIIIGINSNNKVFLDFKNIEKIYNKSSYFFIPIIFPNLISKPNLITFDSSLITKTIEAALDNTQIEPLISISYI